MEVGGSVFRVLVRDRDLRPEDEEGEEKRKDPGEPAAAFHTLVG